MSVEDAGMKRITIDIPEQTWEAATAFVPEGVSPEERLPELVVAAFHEWVSWMEGSFRPTSISELETSRVCELYEHVFLEEMPSADHIGGQLLLPLGRARYLMQALAYRHGRMLRERQDEHIRNALGSAEQDEQGNPFVIIDSRCREIFERTARALRAQGKMSSGIPTGELVLEGVRYGMGEGHLEALKEAFGWEENGTQGG